MNISVVIPTCDRKSNLLALLKNLNESTFPLDEVIIVDSGDERLSEDEMSIFKKINILYLSSEKSVCIQRNIGIRKATSEWIFLCDDDIEVPPEYLQKIASHISDHPEAGAVSGLVLQKENGKWTSEYIESSAKKLAWKYFFQLGIWGTIECKAKNLVIKKIRKYYSEKGNHISKAGWPVLTDFSGNYFTTPVYGLGASIIKKRWLLNSPYDEVLDKHGIGDHYGVAAGFPSHIHIIKNAFVYHHQEIKNRLHIPLQYYRRVLALDHFRRQPQKKLYGVKKRWLTWSLLGNFLYALFSTNSKMLKPTWKSFWTVLIGKNPYYEMSKSTGSQNK